MTDLRDVLPLLIAAGVDAEWHCIPASAVGAPHRRDRIWIVAHARGEQHEGGSAPLSGTLAAELSRAMADASGGRHGVASLEIPTRRDGTIDSSQWSVEPRLGGGPDGFPAWLDRYVARGISHAESRRRVKVLRDLWNGTVSRSLRRAAGGLERISQAQVLFAFVREYENGSDQARLLVAGEEASEDFLRGLRGRSITRSAPRRSGQGKQPGGQHSDALQPVSRLLACDGEANWAGCGWEDATPRVAHAVPHRVDRLEELGNAVVPAIPEIIGKAILQSMREDR